MPSCPEKRKEQQRLRNERNKARRATDPEYAAKQREIERNAKKKYAAKQKQKKMLQREHAGPVKKGKPGRIVSLCGWLGW